MTRTRTARGSETVIIVTMGHTIVATTSSARTTERSLAAVATVDTLTLTRDVAAIVSNQLSVQLKGHRYFAFSYVRKLRYSFQKYMFACSAMLPLVFRGRFYNFIRPLKMLMLFILAS